MKDKLTLEVCVDSVESAVAAERGGADRLELCGNLVIGGTTPEISLYKMVRKAVSIPINIMIRPRYGDFCYSENEFLIMKDAVRVFREMGAKGIVLGILLPDGRLDRKRLEELLCEKGHATATLHRCFDLTNDPFLALEDAVDLGFDTILTSGQAPDCLAGMNLLSDLNRAAGGHVQIMAGSGVDASMIQKLYDHTAIKAYHMSGKRAEKSRMAFRRRGVAMGAPNISEYENFVTDEQNVADAKAVLNRIERFIG